VPAQSSSFIGPLVVGIIADRTGNIRYAFLFLVAMLWAALPVLAGVDVERGRIDAQAWSSGEARLMDNDRTS
jgi:UMF1 family MFS transporter